MKFCKWVQTIKYRAVNYLALGEGIVITPSVSLSVFQFFSLSVCPGDPLPLPKDIVKWTRPVFCFPPNLSPRIVKGVLGFTPEGGGGARFAFPECIAIVKGASPPDDPTTLKYLDSASTFRQK